MKTKIKFAGINDRYHECYVTEKGSYLELFDNEFHFLNQSPTYGFVGINGEPDYIVKKECLEIVEDF